MLKPLSLVDWPWYRIKNIFTMKSRKFVQSLEDPIVVKERVPTLSCNGLKEENHLWFWSTISKNLRYSSFTTSADLPEILLIETNSQRFLHNFCRLTRNSVDRDQLSEDNSHVILAIISLCYISQIEWLKHTALRMMAHLRGDFSNRWLRRCARNSLGSFLNS